MLMPLVLSDVVSLESCVVDVITTMADGMPYLRFRLMLLPIFV